MKITNCSSKQNILGYQNPVKNYDNISVQGVNIWLHFRGAQESAVGEESEC